MGRISPCDALADTIFELNAQRLSRKKIAVRIGLSHQTIQAWLHRRKAPSRPHKERRRLLSADALAAALREDKTQKEIANQFDVSLSCVERSCARFGLKGARTGPRHGSEHPSWRGGRHLDKHGYALVFVPLHPHCRASHYLAEHRLVMEVVLGRYLLPTEVVDHRDDHPRHNWPDNLRLFESNASHLRATLTGREKATRRKSISNAYGNTQKLPRCPSELETLSQCPSEIRAKLSRHIAIHQPTKEHRNLPRRAFRQSGAHQPPFE